MIIIFKLIETPACELFLVYLAISFAMGALDTYTSKTSKDDHKYKSKQLHGHKSQVLKIVGVAEARLM